MRTNALVLGLACALAATGVMAQSAPPSGPRDRVERDRSDKERVGDPKAKPSPEEKKDRPRRRWPGASVTIVPPSEISSSTDRTRADERGVAPTRAAVSSFQNLVGADDAGLKRALGEPETARAEGQGALWTYRLDSCALYVFLARDSAGVLRVKGGSTGPLVRGAPAPALDACVAEAARR